LALWGWGLSAAAAAEPNTIKLEILPADSAPVQGVRPSGFNYGLAMQVALYEQEWEALGVQALRFPPGNDADNFPLTSDMMDAFKVQWELLDQPAVLIVANFFEGPTHALRVARYFEKIGVPVGRWAVGNEPDLYPQNRMDASWTPEVYCARLRRFASVLKSNYPNTLITGPAVSGSRPLGEDYLAEVLRGCGDLLDVLTWHIYPTDGTWDDEAALATSRQVGEEIRRYRAWLKDPARNPRGYARDTALAITEFGLSWRTSSYHHLEDMTAALWLADVLGQMTSEGLGGYYFALQGTGGHGLIDQTGWVRPTYYIFEMLASFSGKVLKPALDSELSRVRVYAVQQGSDVQLLLINQAESEVVLKLGAEASTVPIRFKLLNDAIFEAELGYQTGVAEPGAPLLLPARSVMVAVLSGSVQ